MPPLRSNRVRIVRFARGRFRLIDDLVNHCLTIAKEVRRPNAFECPPLPLQHAGSKHFPLHRVRGLLESIHVTKDANCNVVGSVRMMTGHVDAKTVIAPVHGRLDRVFLHQLTGQLLREDRRKAVRPHIHYRLARFLYLFEYLVVLIVNLGQLLGVHEISKQQPGPARGLAGGHGRQFAGDRLGDRGHQMNLVTCVGLFLVACRNGRRGQSRSIKVAAQAAAFPSGAGRVRR